MPCFYFDIREGTKLTVDNEGLEFVSLDAAESGAISAAADIWRDLLRGSDPRAMEAGPSARVTSLLAEHANELGPAVKDIRQDLAACG